MTKKKKRIVQIVSGAAVVLSVIAFGIAPNLPAAITFLGGLAALLGTLFTSAAADVALISERGRKLIMQVSSEIIPDRAQRQEWSNFDVRFLYECIKDTPRGWVFAGDKAATFVDPGNDRLFGLGVQVYTKCCKRTDRDHTDYRAFNIIAQAYLSARLLLRSSGSGR